MIPSLGRGEDMTLVWFVIWLVWDVVGDREPLTLAPVNFWAGHHATARSKR